MFPSSQVLVTRRAFTLVEIIVSVAILAVVLISIFGAYSNIITINKRLEIMRSLQENTRDMTEAIANDIREHGIDFAYYDGSDVQKKSDYSGVGTPILAIHGGTKYYPMKETVAGLVLCDAQDLSNISTPCFVGSENGSGIRTTITDARVKITSLRFFISGSEKQQTTNLGEEGKATIVFSLESATKAGLSSELAKYTTLTTQTTISEKIYKKD